MYAALVQGHRIITTRCYSTCTLHVNQPCNYAPNRRLFKLIKLSFKKCLEAKWQACQCSHQFEKIASLCFVLCLLLAMSSLTAPNIAIHNTTHTYTQTFVSRSRSASISIKAASALSLATIRANEQEQQILLPSTHL